jgi:hypothetical protein
MRTTTIETTAYATPEAARAHAAALLAHIGRTGAPVAVVAVGDTFKAVITIIRGARS